MEHNLTPKESQNGANNLTDEIYDWAEKRAGESSEYALMLHIRGLARTAAKVHGRGSHPYQTQEEFSTAREAAQDFMELFDSIRYRVEHKEEG